MGASSLLRSLSLAAATGAAALAWLLPASAVAQVQAQVPQSLQAEVAPVVSWGSGGGCEQNIQTQDFGSLTPAPGSTSVGSFDALPHTSASTNAAGASVWVGCLTSNATLASVTAQGTSDMTDAAGASLPLADVTIGTTNTLPGSGCAITAGQQAAGGCALPVDGQTQATLAAGLPAGTNEIDWEYQLALASNQPDGNYTGGQVTLTATAGTTGASGPPPSPITPPVISGTPQVADQLTVSNGQWQDETLGFSYQWQDCDAAGCSPILGATSQTYTPGAADAGDTLEATVTAYNDVGQASATSAPTAPVTGPPVNTLAPVLSTATPVAGSPVTVTDGDWAAYPAPTFTVQWFSCSPVGCSPISGATGSTYTPQQGDIGSEIEATVTATNGVGQSSASSDQAPVQESGYPFNTGLPSITPDAPVQGVQETASPGAWDGSPSFGYQWQRCNGATCTAIAGATAPIYTPTGADVGAALEVLVSASNADGTAQATSPPTQPVQGTDGPPAEAPGGAVTELPDADASGFTNELLTEGADGNLWAGNDQNEAIERISPDGTITSFPLPGGSSPSSVTLGPDGDVWFTAYLPPVVGKIAPDGTLTIYPQNAGDCPQDITTGPDGALWFTKSCADQVVRITTTGQQRAYDIAGDPEDIAAGPD